MEADECERFGIIRGGEEGEWEILWAMGAGEGARTSAVGDRRKGVRYGRKKVEEDGKM